MTIAAIDLETLYANAKDLVLKTRRPSVSVVRRRLGCTYGDAERAIKRMVKEGLVEGPFFDAPTYRMVEPE